MTFPKFYFWPEQPNWVTEYNRYTKPKKILKEKVGVLKNPGVIKIKTK